MHLKRLLFFWFVCYASIMAFNVIAAYVWSEKGFADWVLIAASVSPPVFTLLFGWMFFRHMPGRERLSVRLGASALWVGFGIIFTMALLKYVYHEDPIASYEGVGTAVEALNMMAMLLAGYLAVKHTKIPAMMPAPKSPSSPKRATIS